MRFHLLLAILACLSACASHPPKCATPDDCAKNGCEYRTDDQGALAYVCRDTRENGCWRLRVLYPDEEEPGYGPWHCPETGT